MVMQLIRKPVFVFESTDDGAPQLTPTPGALKTILKACLDTGYGSKPGLGWLTQFEDATSAIFKMQSGTSTGCCLRVNNQLARAAIVSGGLSADSLTEVRGEFKSDRSYLATFSNYDNVTKKWMLIGHDSTFIFIFSTGGYVRFLFFGDYPSYLPADSGNCILSKVGSMYETILGPASKLSFLSNLSSDNDTVTAKGIDRINSNILVLNTLFHKDRLTPYPDPVSGGFNASEIYLHEIGSGFALRGLLPGVVSTGHNIEHIDNFSVIDQFDGSNDQFIKISIDFLGGSSQACWLINKTAWPSLS